MKYLLALLAFLLPATAALAQDGVTLTSAALVERVSTDAQGKEVKTLEPASTAVPGDAVVFVLTFKNGGSAPATNLVVVNTIDANTTYVGDATQGEEVSIDGGKTWGALASLTVSQADGTTRPAQPADVTDVRWTIAGPIAPGAEGKLSFRAVIK